MPIPTEDAYYLVLPAGLLSEGSFVIRVEGETELSDPSAMYGEIWLAAEFYIQENAAAKTEACEDKYPFTATLNP